MTGSLEQDLQVTDSRIRVHAALWAALPQRCFLPPVPGRSGALGLEGNVSRARERGGGLFSKAPRRASGWWSLLLASRGLCSGVMAWGRSQNLSAGGPFILLGFPGPRGLHVGALPAHVHAHGGREPGHSLAGRGTLAPADAHVLFPLQPLLPGDLARHGLHAQDAGRLYLTQRSHLLLRLRCADALRLLSGLHRGLPAGRHGLRPLPSHLPAAALWQLHDARALWPPGPGLLALRLLGHHRAHGPLRLPLLWLTGRQPLLGHPALDRAAFCVILGSHVITLAYDVTTLGVITLVYDVTTLHVITLVSYAHIVVAVVRTPSLQGRRPAFPTCSSHLAVVLIWYGPTVFLHVRTLVESSLDLTKAVTVLSTIVTPVLNPFIYTLRSEDVKDALRKAVRRT